jgi:copper resistance protein B
MSSMPGMQMPAGNAPAGQPAHGMSSMPGMQMPAGNPPAGQPAHDMSSMPGHDMSNMREDAADPPVAPPSAAARSGPAHAADMIYPAERMLRARDILRDEHGAIRTHLVLVDQLEARVQNGRDGYSWDAQAWYGGAIDRLWLKSQGEGTFGSSPEQAEVQALWSRALDPWFNLQAGVRYDFRPDPERGYLVLGIEGLASYWFEIDGAFFLSEKGDLSARLQAAYDQRITQRLILQPRVDLELSLQDVPEIGIGSGLSSAEAGLRLRYEIVPEFAPYVGVNYSRSFGDTARFRRAAGEDVGGWSLVVGIRTWF